MATKKGKQGGEAQPPESEEQTPQAPESTPSESTPSETNPGADADPVASLDGNGGERVLTVTVAGACALGNGDRKKGQLLATVVLADGVELSELATALNNPNLISLD